MRVKVCFLIFCSILLQNFSMSAQRKADVVVPFNDNIESIVLNQSTGSIIVKDKNQISSYDPEYNTFEWQIKEEDLIKSSMLENGVKADQMMKALENSDFDQILDKKKDEITFISNSPFIRITFDKADVIINSLNGQVAFNSRCRISCCSI